MSKHAVVTCHEVRIHRTNQRGQRQGIFGVATDLAERRELDQQAKAFGVERKRRTWFGVRLPWSKESDESLRTRLFIAYQSDFVVGGPCIHNTWVGYDGYTQCGDCGERLCWVSTRTVEKMDLFMTKLPED